MFPSASMSVAALVRCACIRYPSCRCRSVTYPINLEDGGHEVLPCSTLRASMSAGVAMSCCRALFTPDQSRGTPFRRRGNSWSVHSGTTQAELNERPDAARTDRTRLGAAMNCTANTTATIRRRVNCIHRHSLCVVKIMIGHVTLRHAAPARDLLEPITTHHRPDLVSPHHVQIIPLTPRPSRTRYR